MMEPKLSVVMCCYNSEKYISETIQSILNQTFKEFEFIIWDDGSTDNTKRIIDSFSDSRIRYFYHENMGVGKAAKAACREVRSEIIARIDSDDVCYPERLLTQYEYLLNHPDIDLVGSAVDNMDSQGRYIGINYPYTSPKLIRKIMLRGGDLICHSTSMYRVSAYKRAGEYPEVMNRVDDILFRRMIKSSKFINLPQSLVRYRICENSISSSMWSNPYYEMLAIYANKMVDDEYMLAEDFDLYNKLCNRAKEYNKGRLLEVTNKRLRGAVWLKYLSAFSRIKIIRKLILSAKNIAGYIIY